MFIQYGHFLFKWRNQLFPLVLIFLFVFFPPATYDTDSITLLINIIGILVIVLAQSIRAAVIGLAYIKRGGVNKKIYADTLVTEGVFRHCRNPLYVGNLLIISGYLILHGNPWVYLIGGIYFLVSYQAIVLAEESFLLEKFGNDFQEYCKKVNRWIINPVGLNTTLNSMKFNWTMVLFKDYTTMATWMTVILFIFMLRHFHQYGMEQTSGFLTISSLILLLISTFVVSVRFIKKNGRLIKS